MGFAQRGSGGPSLEIFKIKLDGALSNLLLLKMSLLTARWLEPDDL